MDFVRHIIYGYIDSTNVDVVHVLASASRATNYDRYRAAVDDVFFAITVSTTHCSGLIAVLHPACQ